MRSRTLQQAAGNKLTPDCNDQPLLAGSRIMNNERLGFRRGGQITYLLVNMPRTVKVINRFHSMQK